MGNCRSWFRPDQQPQREILRHWSSESKGCVKHENNRRQRQYNRGLIRDQLGDLIERTQ